MFLNRVINTDIYAFSGWKFGDVTSSWRSLGELNIFFKSMEFSRVHTPSQKLSLWSTYFAQRTLIGPKSRWSLLSWSCRGWFVGWVMGQWLWFWKMFFVIGILFFVIGILFLHRILKGRILWRNRKECGQLPENAGSWELLNLFKVE